MIINELILESMGATTEQYYTGESIFSEDDIPKYYYQIIEGKVKLNNYNNEGREILQSVLELGQSVGESVLFVESASYPVNAIAISCCRIFKLRKSAFFEMLKKNPDISLEINKHLSKILHFKQIMAPILCSHSPVFKIKALLDYLKRDQLTKEPFTYQVPYTRQEMANFTGLCVETTIRTIKTMERDNVVKIHNRKILY
jgi:CRP-like cAMP-binding protein